jgi:hypothetical protein
MIIGGREFVVHLQRLRRDGHLFGRLRPFHGLNSRDRSSHFVNWSAVVASFEAD